MDNEFQVMQEQTASISVSDWNAEVQEDEAYFGDEELER